MRKIFIVEDDRFITAIFTMFLRDLGHDLVGRTSSGKEAIEKCKELKPDVVLMDIHLEGDLDGIQTAEMLKREIEVPIIYISSDTSSQVIERAIVSNSYGYLVKPINKKELGISIDLAYYKHKVDVEQKQREQSYREFISNSPMPIVVVRNGKIMYLNRLGLDFFKTHYIEDIMGLPVIDFVHEESMEVFTEVLDSFDLSENRIPPFLVKMKTVHGDLYWAEITGSKVRFNNQQSVQLILRDISSKKLIEDKLVARENILLDTGKVSIILNNRLDVVRCSDAVVSRLNANKDEIIGKSIKELFGVDQGWVESFNAQINKTTSVNKVEFPIKDGGNFELNVWVTHELTKQIHEIILFE